MAGLKMVHVGNVIYVTSIANSGKFEKEIPHAGYYVRELYIAKQPLKNVLKDLFRANLLIDPRVAEKANTPVTANFINETNPGVVLRLLTDMAGLKAVIADNVCYITDPANAARIEQEELRIQQENEKRKQEEKKRRNDPFS